MSCVCHVTAGPWVGGVVPDEARSGGACRQACWPVFGGQSPQAVCSHSSPGDTSTTAAGEVTCDSLWSRDCHVTVYHCCHVTVA